MIHSCFPAIGAESLFVDGEGSFVESDGIIRARRVCQNGGQVAEGPGDARMILLPDAPKLGELVAPNLLSFGKFSVCPQCIDDAIASALSNRVIQFEQFFGSGKRLAT